MNRRTIENAYAKINLMLDMVGIRGDGYHLIDGVMQTVSLADRLDVEFCEDPTTRIELCVTGEKENVPADASNLAYRVAKIYLDAVGASGIVKITLRKEIPTAAGLAGGSADAAAGLRALNRIFGNRLTVNELCALGVQLGADVPFCLRGGAMRTEGIGEKLTPCAGLPACWLVIAKANPVSFSTPAMYAELDRLYNRFSGYPSPAEEVEKLIQVLRKGDLSGVCGSMKNIFETPAFQMEQGRVKTLKSDLLACPGAMGALMSGSGSAVFCVFERVEQARAACRMLQAQADVQAWVARPISQEFPIC